MGNEKKVIAGSGFDTRIWVYSHTIIDSKGRVWWVLKRRKGR